MLMQYVALAGELLRWAAYEVPVLGEPCCSAQRPFSPLPPIQIGGWGR